MANEHLSDKQIQVNSIVARFIAKDTGNELSFDKVLSVGSRGLLGIVQDEDEGENHLYLMDWEETDGFNSHVLVARELIVYDSGEWDSEVAENARDEAKLVAREMAERRARREQAREQKAAGVARG